MNKKLSLLFCAVLSTFSLSYGQNAAPWFTVKEVGPKVWQISDHGADNMYLVEGRDSAMLIDDGLGIADLVTLVKKLTSKPLIVVITHGHPDHAGSDYQFAKVYIHPADSSAARGYNKPETRSGSSATMTGGNKPSADELYKGKIYHTKMVPIHDGSSFDLGDRKIRVLETPGHTPGEICLLDVKNKFLFTGDNSNSLVWLFLQNCTPLHVYLTTLENLVKRLPDFTTLFPGHGVPMPSDFLKDQVACVKGILDGSLERKPYQSFAGNSLICTYGRASVAFDPNNL